MIDAQPTDKLMIPESRDVLGEGQARLRRRAVSRALETPFWRERMAGIGLDLDRVTEPREWAKIPILDKDQLRALPTDAFYRDFCRVGRRETSEFWRSGGSTGRPLFYPRTHTDLYHAMIGFQRIYACAGATRDDLVHVSMPFGIHPAGHLCARAAEAFGCATMWVGAGNAAPSMLQLDLIRNFRPSIWVGMSSYALHLANLAAADGLDLAGCGIEKLICTAEPISDAKRDKIESVWGARVFDCIGMTEMMMTGAETGLRGGFRLWSDFCYPEVLDPDTHEPVADGETGVLVMTALASNEATPFLRWNTGDIASLDAEAGGEGPFAVFPVLRHAHRVAGFFKVRGINIGYTDFEDLMFRLPMVDDFRVEAVARDGNDLLVIHLEGTREQEDAVRAAVRRTFEVSPELVWRERGAIARDFESAVKAPRFADLRQ